MKVKHIPTEQIIVRKNVRKDCDEELGGLIESIRDHDILQPILVRPENGKYLLIAGHRRLRAVKASGEPFIPALIRDDITDDMIPILQLTENIQRKQMKPWELVEVFDEMRQKNRKMTHKKIAALLGKSEAWVYMKYRATKVYEKLLDAGLTEEECENFTEGELYRMAKKGRIAKALDGRAANSGRKRYEYVGGFEIVQLAEHKVMLLFRDMQKMRTILKYLEKFKNGGI